MYIFGMLLFMILFIGPFATQVRQQVWIAVVGLILTNMLPKHIPSVSFLERGNKFVVVRLELFIFFHLSCVVVRNSNIVQNTGTDFKR